MPQIQLAAPAKLNLHLHIGDRRPDGFHDIESLFLALAFGDTLSFETIHKPQVLEICMDWQIPGGFPDGKVAIPPPRNIISRAVSLFRDRTGYEKGLKITVEKRIPLGGGLGGGSSDAAAALLALNHFAAPDGKGLVSDVTLAEMGASLGSDVPFFLWCQAPFSAAWVSGRGEIIQPLEIPEPARSLSFMLVNPGFPSDTAEAYRLFDQYGPKTLFVCHSRELLAQFLSGPPTDWPFVNDFLPVFAASAVNNPSCDEHLSNYQDVISPLREWGADFAGLSGSGSTCFGVFSVREQALTAQKSLSKRWPFVIVTEFFSGFAWH